MYCNVFFVHKMKVIAVQRFFQISSSVFNRGKYVMQVWNSMRVSHFSIFNSLNRPIVLLRFVCNSLFVYHFHCGAWMFLCMYSSNKSLKSRLIKYFICSLFYFVPLVPFHTANWSSTFISPPLQTGYSFHTAFINALLMQAETLSVLKHNVMLLQLSCFFAFYSSFITLNQSHSLCIWITIDRNRC